MGICLVCMLRGVHILSDVIVKLVSVRAKAPSSCLQCYACACVLPGFCVRLLPGSV